MKKIEAKIRKSKFKEVKQALIEGGFHSFNYHLTRCISRKSEKRVYQGVEVDTKASERIDFAIYIRNADEDKVLDIIVSAGVTGDAYDSYLAVYDIGRTYAIRNIDGKDRLIQV